MPTLAQFNQQQFNESLPIASIPSTDASPIEKFRIEARSKTGSLLAYLDEWDAGSYKQSLNAPAQLTFTHPALSDKAQHVVFPNQVWLYDQRNELIDKFHILPVTQEQSKTRLILQVDCESLLYQLSKEIISSYVATQEQGKTVKEVLEDWLNDYQVNSLPIRPGYIEGSIARQQIAISIHGKSILAAIGELFTLVNRGVFYVDSSRRFIWKNRMRNYAGQQIRVGKNLQGIKIKQDTSKLINRVYVYGHDSGPDGRYSLINAGELNEYRQDSSSVSTYGVHAATKVLKNVRDPSILSDYADAVLDTYSQPFFTYEIDVADLEQVNPSLDHERIQLGSIVRVINEDLNVSTRDTIVSVERDLNSPANVKVVLANKLPEITDHYVDLLNRITELENTPIHDLADAEEEDDYASAVGEDVDGPTSVGTSTKAARADHTHPLSANVGTWDSIENEGTLPELLEDILGADSPDALSYQDALEQFIGDTLGSGDGGIAELVAEELASDTVPAPIVSTTGTAGTSDEYMRADATIQGMPWKTANDKATLESAMEEGEIGHTTGTDKRAYIMIDGSLICFTHLEE